MPTDVGKVSMIAGLQKMLGDIAGLQVAQDADPEFLTKLQMALTQRIKQGAQSPTGGPGQQAGGGPPQPPPGGGMPPPPGAPPGGAPGQQIGGAGIQPGINPGMGNMEEIKKILSQGGGGGQGGAPPGAG